MSKKTKLTVKMNGEQLDENKSQQKPSHLTQTYDEQAATIEKMERKPSFFARDNNNSIESFHPSKNTKFGYISEFKPIIIAVVTAVIIGSILGFILLKVFMSIGNGMANPGNSNPVVNVDQASNDSTDDNKDKVKVPAIQAYILQGGVFSEKSNAKEYAKKFESKDIPTVIWERDGQFILITGLTNTMDKANDMADEQEKKDLEVIVKDWETPEIKAKLSKQEEKWMTSLHGLIAASIEDINHSDKIPVDKWQSLLKENTNDSEKLLAIKKSIKPHIESLQTDKQPVVQGAILNIWHEFEHFFND